MEIRIDDLSSAATTSLIALHVAEMEAASPEDSCHALDLDELRDPSITFWSAWIGDELAGIIALVQLDGQRGELKSMRVVERFRGQRIGQALLAHVVAEAADRGTTSLWLETGRSAKFAAAQRFYERAGFVECEPFAGYAPDPHSLFMTMTLSAP